MAVFDEKQDELEHFEARLGIPRGRLAVTMDLVTDAMALIGQHGVYCQSQRWPGRPVMDIQLIMKNLTGVKELIQSVMEELRSREAGAAWLTTKDTKEHEGSLEGKHLCATSCPLWWMNLGTIRRRFRALPATLQLESTGWSARFFGPYSVSSA